MSIIVLSGPLGAGLHAIARTFAGARPRCAIVDSELVRWMVVQPPRSTWDAALRDEIARLAVDGVVAVATTFEAAGIDVVVVESLTPSTAVRYRDRLPQARLVLIVPPLEELLRRRAEQRPHGVSAEDVVASYRAQQEIAGVERIDEPDLAAEQVVARLLSP